MPSNLHVNRRLSDVSMMFPFQFEPVGQTFFPERVTDNLSDQVAQFSKANLLGLRDGAPIGDVGLPTNIDVVYDSDISFGIGLYGMRSPDKWITSRNADPALSYEVARTYSLTAAMRTRMEYLRVNQRLRSTSVMTTNKTLLSGERFDNFGSGSSNPITLLQAYSDLIADRNQGRRANRAMCAIQTLRAIAKSEEFKDYGVKYNIIPDQSDIEANPNGIARIVEQMINIAPGSLKVHDATYNAGTIANPSFKKFIGSDFVMAYVEPLGLMGWTACVGWRWSALPGENSIIEVPDYTGPIPTTAFHIINATEPQVIKPELAVLIKGCVDTTATGNNALD